MQDTILPNPKEREDWPVFLAEQIRRLSTKEFAELVSVLCEDNMGSRLQAALSYENLDREFRKE
tara:strand:- start:42 stop:233 length:192 start_codon:yes stop_codon:yes gene_type:complete